MSHVLPELPLEYSGDFSENSETNEARLFCALNAPVSNPVHMLVGPGGTGKTTTFLAVGRHPKLKQLFHVVWFISLGQSADAETLLASLEELVREVLGDDMGNKMKRWSALRNNQQRAVSFAVEILRQKKILLLLDDVWVKEGDGGLVQASVFSLVKQLVLGVQGKTGGNMRVAVSSRDSAVARIFPDLKIMKASTLGALSSEAKKLICSYAGFVENEITGTEKKAFEEVLRQCAGLILTLAVAGKSIRARLEYEKRTDVWGIFLDDVRNGDGVLREDESDGMSIGKIVEGSLKTVEMGVRSFGEGVDVPNWFQALGIMRKEKFIPWSCLKLLWDCENTTVKRFCHLLARVNLVSIDKERGIRLHLRIQDYCTYISEKGRMFEVWHAKFLQRLYEHMRTVSILEVTEPSYRGRIWWALNSNSDELHQYLLNNVLWHLVQAKLFNEGLSVLCDFRWTQARVIQSDTPNKMAGIEEDVELFLGAKGITWPQTVQRGLMSMFEAMRLSTQYVSSNPKELAFQLYGRLAHQEDGNQIVARYIWSLKAHAELPWLCPSHGVLQPVSDTISTKASLSASLDCLQVIPDSENVVIGGSGGFLALFNLPSARILHTFSGHQDYCYVTDVAVGKNTKVLYSGGSDRSLRQWNLETGDEIRVPDFPHQSCMPKCLVLTEDEHYLIVGWDDGFVYVLDAKTFATRRAWQAHDGAVRVLRIAAKTETILSGGDDGKVKKWRFENGELMEVLLEVADQKARDISLTADEKRAAVAVGFDVYDIGTECRSTPYRFQRFDDWKVLGVQVGPDQLEVYLAMEDGTTRLLKHDGSVERLARSHNSRLTRIALSNDKSVIISTSADRTLSTLKCKRPERNRNAEDPTEMNRLANLAVFPDRKRVVYAWEDRPQGLWLMEFERDSNSIDVVPTSSSYFLSLYNFMWGVVESASALWSRLRLENTNLDAGQEHSNINPPARVVAGEDTRVTTIAISPDQRHVAIGTDTGKVMLLNVHNWSPSAFSLRKLRGRIVCLRFSPNSELVAASSTGSSVGLWNVDRKCEIVLPSKLNKDDRVWVVAFNEESTGLVAIVDREPERIAMAHFWKGICAKPVEYHCRRLLDVLGIEYKYISIGVGLYMTEKYFAMRSERNKKLRVFSFADQNRMNDKEESAIFDHLLGIHDNLSRGGRLTMAPFSSEIKYMDDNGNKHTLGTLESSQCHSFYPDQWVFHESSGRLVAGGLLRKLVSANLMENSLNGINSPKIPFLLEDYHAITSLGREIQGDKYTLFIGHAGPDKNDIAIPLYDRLRQRDYISFVDIVGIHPGEHAPKKMQRAMDMAMVAIFILSPEFVARKWPIKELLRFLRRYEKEGPNCPALIPVFYRLSRDQCKSPDLYKIEVRPGEKVFEREGFYDPVRLQETSWEKVHEALMRLSDFQGVLNKHEARGSVQGECGMEKNRREQLLDDITDQALRALRNAERGNRKKWGVGRLVEGLFGSYSSV